MIIYGINRWGHVKEQFDNMFYREQCRELLKSYIRQLHDYNKNDYIIAIDGSPSCGYNKTCSSNGWFGELSNCENLQQMISDVNMVNGKGIFMEELEILLNENKLNIPILGFDECKNQIVNNNMLLK